MGSSVGPRRLPQSGVKMSDLLGQGFRYMHEPVGDFGVWNGQFEQEAGSASQPDVAEGWEFLAYEAGSYGARVTGGLAGNWCFQSGNTGYGRGGYLTSLKYIPVSEDRDYMLTAAFKGSSAGVTAYMGVECYSAAKVFMGRVWAIGPATPGIAWVYWQKRIGPNGDVALFANTRYVRVSIVLQWNSQLTNASAYVDDVQFQQMKMAYSPGIHLVNGHITRVAADDFTAQAWTLYPGTPITLTFEEPGYIWYSYAGYGEDRTAADSPWSFGVIIFIDGAQETSQTYTATAAANDIHNWNIGMIRSNGILAIGNHTVDIRVYVRTAGHTVRMLLCVGSAFYTRAY